MTNFLDLASKALAVIGVLSLMYAGSVTPQAKADLPGWVPGRCYVNNGVCSGTICEPLKCCCWDHGPWSNDNGSWCCDELCPPCRSEE